MLPPPRGAALSCAHTTYEKKPSEKGKWIRPRPSSSQKVCSHQKDWIERYTWLQPQLQHHQPRASAATAGLRAGRVVDSAPKISENFLKAELFENFAPQLQCPQSRNRGSITNSPPPRPRASRALVAAAAPARAPRTQPLSRLRRRRARGEQQPPLCIGPPRSRPVVPRGPRPPPR